MNCSNDRNFTIAIFPSDTSEETCEDGNLDTAFVLTFSDIPRTETCFNVSSIFGNNSRTGFQNDTIGWRASDEENDEKEALSRGVDVEDLTPKGIHWYRPNNDEPDFSSDGNFTKVWFRQVNETGGEDEIGAGKDGRWVLHTYAFEDCQQTVPGNDIDDDSDAWFKSSCQTEDEGQCETLERSIKSFRIRPYIQEDFGNCHTWAFKAAGSGTFASMGAALGAGFVAALFLL